MTFWRKWKDKLHHISVWGIGLLTGTLFLGIGIYENQLTDIMKKAIMICLECIGIG